ncbi:TetR/AcrR family transcriptional regulator [Bordetella genomosp. 13]|uniref:TetR family transcriptional regulator n=1 Tax=Bordetella genomosp. 13 TaxID=463040 RepID=A0A1W6ZFK9_9BORD|nr:TetR/AcrR family transcriptional regulator [Bordetella genomosp. 13]ARP96097.1 TetR family transcriptional regulator [Bordetella genomosp. 13]
MATAAKPSLKPRKQPRQARSQATVDAIFDATIQVLLADGLQRLTTIRVAERAGASVGTLYQYYPHKQALLYAVLERHLGRIGDAIEKAAASVHGKPLATMVATVVRAFIKAKTEHIEEGRALYAVAGELDSRPLVLKSRERAHAILAAMLATAEAVEFADLPTVSYMFAAAMTGSMHAVMDGSASAKLARALPGQLESLCLGYLERESRPRKTSVAK